MALIIETGAGIYNANTYVHHSQVTAYLKSRNRISENSWNRKSSAEKEAAVISATDYVDKRFSDKFRGLKKFYFTGSKATSTLTLSAAPTNGNTFLFNTDTFTFVTGPTANDREIIIGANDAETVSNLVTVLRSFVSGFTFVVNSTNSSVVDIQSNVVGKAATFTTIDTSATANLSSTIFINGNDSGPQPLEFPRKQAHRPNGTVIEGIPVELMQAVFEYTVRAAASVLLVDPTARAAGTSGNIVRVRERIEGAIDTETEYSDQPGAYLSEPLQSYPAADFILKPLLLSGSRVIRG